ncbi:MAG: carboxylesterase/lipase family protein [Agathobacter sp.]
MKTFCYDDVPVVETTSGKLKGYFYDGTYIYKGVPYAYADRFQMPVPSKWEGVKDATSYGFVCPLMAQDTPSAELMVPHRYWPMDEHCQNLNIWTKELNNEAKKPVVVWLHGGGYFAGSSIEQVAYDGHNMCVEGDVVVVSINHRLNILGYLDLAPFGEKYYNSGNAGHADMVAALQWIHDNIAVFGGDPENVTIFGQSGGGMKVADLMQIPAADGLFHKGLIMSGVADAAMLPSQTGSGEKIVEAMLNVLGLTTADVEQLETIPYPELVKAYTKAMPAVAMSGAYVGNGPQVNDWFLGNPLQHGMREHAYEIPVMIGSVFGEFAFAPAAFDKTALTETEINEIVGKVYGEHTKDILAAFAKAYPGKNLTDILNIDRAMRQPSKKLAAMHAKGNKAGTFLYNFTLEFPMMNKIAWHCSDIPFFFHNTDKVEVCQIPGVTEKLKTQMFGAFMNFVKTGVPAQKNLPEWTSVTETEEPTMIFDRECEVRYHYDDELFQLIDSILPPFNIMEMLAAQNVQH